MDLEKAYSDFFSEFFENVKEEFRKSISSKEADELSSGELALRDGISSLPCPVNIVRLKIDTKRYEKAENNVYHLIAYDFSNFGESAVKYYGEIDLDEIEKHNDLLKDFGLDEQNIKELQSFEWLGYGYIDHWRWVWIIPYDILENPEAYAKEFIRSFWDTFWDKILQKFDSNPGDTILESRGHHTDLCFWLSFWFFVAA